MAYAENTSVPVDRSKNEIRKIIYRYGGSNYKFAESEELAMVMFSRENRILKFVLSFPDPEDSSFTETPTGRGRTHDAAFREYEQEIRRRWRALALSIKGKFETVESEISSFEEEFMAHIVLPSGTTMAEAMVPQIEQAYAGGETPRIPLLIE